MASPVDHDHPLRSALAAEMHLRRLPRLTAPCRLVQVLTVLDESQTGAARAHIDALAQRAGIAVQAGARHAVLDVDGVPLVWERHSEFATYLLIRPGTSEPLFAPTLFEPLAGEVLAGMPGAVLRATQIALIEDGGEANLSEITATWFSPDALVTCDVASGKARILSDFRLNDDGYGRLLIIDHGLQGDEAAQLVQNLQELGNYRNMALLGLPLAQALTPEVTGLETRLAKLTHSVAESGSTDEMLLDELTFLSAELARLLADTRYRMSATRAYAQISAERLHGLDIVRVPGFQTLADFTERRLTPALRTCESFSLRLDDLSQRAAWTSELLRTRIEVALARQNRDLLDSMDQRTRMQLRLQRAVEGLSVAAISYYLVALLAYPLALVPGIRHDVALAIAVPSIALAVALAIRRLRRELDVS